MFSMSIGVVDQGRAARRICRVDNRVLATDKLFKKLLQLPEPFSHMHLACVLLDHPARAGGGAHAGVDADVCLA